MPSASTHVCSSHHTRSFHSRRRVAFLDDELLERQFRAAGADRWLRSPSTRAAIATFGARLPVLAHKPLGGPSEDAAWLASATHPKPLHTLRLADSQTLRESPCDVHGLGRSAVDAAFRALEPTPRNSHRLPLTRAGAASRCRAWIVPGARPRNRTPLVPTAHANDRCGERIGHRPNPTERPRQRDAPRTGPRHLKPPAEPTEHP
jgi:hypothetical protein